MEVFASQLDRLAVRRAVGGVVPGVAVAVQRRLVRDLLLGDEAFERGEPMVIVSLAGVGTARALRALDLGGARDGPFAPRKYAALVQRERQRKGLRLPRLAEHRAVAVLRPGGGGGR